MNFTFEKQDYNRRECAVFRKTREDYGGLSNMASGYSLLVNDIKILTLEALYQACRFPHLPEVQRLIIVQKSPMAAKMKSRSHRRDSREDWDKVRVIVMRWCLRVKLAQNWNTFGSLLRSTGDLAIVEESKRDTFWGAKPVDDNTLEGVNTLGRLLMELRSEYLRQDNEFLHVVKPLSIKDFLLYGRPIETISKKRELSGSKTNKPAKQKEYVQPTWDAFT